MYISLRVGIILSCWYIHHPTFLFRGFVRESLEWKMHRERFDRMKHVLPVYSFPLLGGDWWPGCMHFFWEIWVVKDSTFARDFLLSPWILELFQDWRSSSQCIKYSHMEMDMVISRFSIGYIGHSWQMEHAPYLQEGISAEKMFTAMLVYWMGEYLTTSWKLPFFLTSWH